ncbi:related to Fe2+/Zn2+ regulated transporter [Rhynchosporium agropyri]|uniref:Related to Fe2+/Zn2+ regulated transporter n=1 Tax=Rhynchosporium agropyri TaxID=914238 RepID=A0A1E1JRT7_9HELO|nr:related to Fe2+/Zn2+ regulated transporter [Rhynchosporium agropyri]
MSPSDRAMFRRHAAAASCNVPEISDDYNLPLHVGALFIILAVSFSACVLPLVVVKVPKLRIPPTTLFLVRHFGTGVLVATAFVHLLPTAFLSLTNPCLPKFWHETYPSMAGAIALAAVFSIIIIQMVLSPGKNCCAFPASMMEKGPVAGQDQDRGVVSRDPPEQSAPGTFHGRDVSMGRQLQQVTAHSATLAALEGRPSQPSDKHGMEPLSSGTFMSPEQKHKKETMQCVLLELGILFHSVFIGMAISVATGNDFVVLLIAISFHQSFEGLALGSRIAALSWKPKAWQPWLMALAYGCTTPIGQAIGLATHTLYSPESQTGLLIVGIFNAISAGLLTYASIADLIVEDFLSDESWRVLRGKRRIFASLLFTITADPPQPARGDEPPQRRRTLKAQLTFETLRRRTTGSSSRTQPSQEEGIGIEKGPFQEDYACYAGLTW